MGALRRFQVWAYGLVGGCIGGGCEALLAALTLAAAKSVGMNVPQLNWHAFGIIFLTGVLTHGCMYLVKSPLPKLSSGDTERLEKKHKHVR